MATRNRRRDVTLVRSVTICEAVAASKSGPPGAAPPEPTQLPVEPTRPYPLDELKSSTRTGSSANDPVVVSSSEFDVAFITPPTLYRASQRPDWTGGRTTRSPEAEARIGQLTEFGAWSEYFAELPPVLIVRVTPKLVEGFWKRLAREAARTQGAALPPFKDFKTDFLRLRASCGGADLVPIHPFVLEHRVSEKDVIREGLYVFDPECVRASLQHRARCRCIPKRRPKKPTCSRSTPRSSSGSGRTSPRTVHRPGNGRSPDDSRQRRRHLGIQRTVGPP